MEKILTISIAAYNAELDIKRCLDSFISTNVLGKFAKKGKNCIDN